MESTPMAFGVLASSMTVSFALLVNRGHKFVTAMSTSSCQNGFIDISAFGSEVVCCDSLVSSVKELNEMCLIVNKFREIEKVSRSSYGKQGNNYWKPFALSILLCMSSCPIDNGIPIGGCLPADSSSNRSRLEPRQASPRRRLRKTLASQVHSLRRNYHLPHPGSLSGSQLDRENGPRAAYRRMLVLSLQTKESVQGQLQHRRSLGVDDGSVHSDTDV
mmetsp:Transcript_44036/g.171894  ORF Transcript_44036/g.171894 Transcript_44036/m.171894 type:complete len:218 (-) Transcript_44036:736-1389(-)